MRVERAGDFLFSVLAVVTAILLLLPGLAARLAGHIWSWEGFLRTQGSALVKIGILFCVIALLVIWLLMRLQRRLSFGVRYEMLKWMCLCFVAAVALIVLPPEVSLRARWFEKYHLVAHAGGLSPNGNIYANSLEAFEHNYRLGHRVFEGDLSFTADGMLVLEHDWKHWCRKVGVEYTGDAVTYEQFMAARYYGTETPMDIAALIDLMVSHEDMYFMTDYKNCYDKEQVVSGFQQMVQAAKDAGRVDVLDRVIVQNQHNEFKHWVEEVYPFKNWLYTIYSVLEEEDRRPENFTAYCVRENIPVITMWAKMAGEEWYSLAQAQNLLIFVHTLDDADQANELIAAGVTGVYTDSIEPGQIPPTGW